MYKPTEQTLGSFVEKDYGCDFTYKLTTDPWALSHGMIHEIDTGLGTSFALVKKTVALVVINELSGSPVIEHWKIKRHVVFAK
jgi:hypothetical protein